MRFLSMASPGGLNRGIKFFSKCWKEKALVQRWFGKRDYLDSCLAEQESVQRWFGKREFLNSCLAEQDFLDVCLKEHNLLEFYLNTRKKLHCFNINEGTVLFPYEHQFLKELTDTANTLPGPIVEIGTLFGFTTSRFAVWRNPSKKIITVDNYSWNPWGLAPVIHKQLTRQFLSYLAETGQVEIVDMDKNEFYANYKGEAPSLVFFDSIHDYETTRDDIAWARRVGAKIIAGHDYHEDFPGVVKAVAEAGGLGGRSGVVWTLKSEYVKSSRSAA